MKFKLFLFVLVFSVSALSYSQSEGIITIDSSPAIEKVITNKIAYNKEYHLIDGYRIQLLFGSENEVNTANSKFQIVFPNTPSYVVFDSPDWKIRVGNYKTRLDADRALKKFKLEFGDAFIMNFKITDK